MTASAVLEVFAVDEKVGAIVLPKLVKNLPTFLPKNTWRFYSYSVLRERLYTQTAINDLVEGDIVTLKAGDIVPATMRLLRASSLTVLEDHISGTSAPAHKQTFASKSLLPTSQQKNMLFAGSEVLQGSAKGIIVRLAQHEDVPRAKQVRNRGYKKQGIVVQSPQAIRNMQHVTTVFFDDLQQPAEVLHLVHTLYQQKHINVGFFVNIHLKTLLQKTLPPEVFTKTSMHGIAVYGTIPEHEKAALIAKANTAGEVTMLVHRGSERSLVPKIAAVNMVISPHAAQGAIRQADLIADRISVAKFSSILYNKK